MAEIINIGDRLKSKPKQIRRTRKAPTIKRVRKAPIQTIDPMSIPELYDATHLKGFDDPRALEALKRSVYGRVDEEEEKAIQLVNHYQRNWKAFFKNELGLNTTTWRDDHPPGSWTPKQGYPLWSAQRNIIDLLMKHKKVAVKSGHGVSKTHTAAPIVLYLTYVHGASGLTTSTVFRQVRRGLWGEIHKLWSSTHQWRYQNDKPPLGGRINQTSIEIDPNWYVEGFTTNNPEQKIPGIHGGKMFAIIDEAGAIDPTIFDMIETVLTNDDAWVLLLGNPTDPTHPFNNFFKPGSGYATYTISCLDCPNVKHDRNIFPGMTTKGWCDDRKKRWGEDSALYRSRVLGEFPKAGKAGLIPYHFIEAALRRDLPIDRCVTLGVDVARMGGDKIVITSLHESGRLVVRETFDKARITETEGRIKHWADELSWYDSEGNKYIPIINVDDIGVGGGVTDHLLEDGYPVNGIDVSKAANDTADEDGRVKFKNKRAQYYYQLAQDFITGKISIMPLTDDRDDVHNDLANELSKIMLKPNSQNSIQIMEKDQIKKLLKGNSPDIVESAMLARSELEFDEDQSLVGFL
jgi:hypothetical protein